MSTIKNIINAIKNPTISFKAFFFFIFTIGYLTLCYWSLRGTFYILTFGWVGGNGSGPWGSYTIEERAQRKVQPRSRSYTAPTSTTSMHGDNREEDKRKASEKMAAESRLRKLADIAVRATQEYNAHKRYLSNSQSTEESKNTRNLLAKFRQEQNQAVYEAATIVNNPAFQGFNSLYLNEYLKRAI